VEYYSSFPPLRYSPPVVGDGLYEAQSVNRVKHEDRKKESIYEIKINTTI
jgi:hypothetical protein